MIDRHRVFIAINLPEYVKSKLNSFQFKWPELPCRWTKKENFHITLEFLGYLKNEEIIRVCQKIKKMAANKNPFTVRLNKICYGPFNKKPERMVWAIGERIEEFNLDPHVTLGRLKMWEFRKIEDEEKPEINEDIDLSFDVNSIELMESKLKKGGAQYMVLASFMFNK